MTQEKSDYIHGYSELEQQRLIQQARYWQQDLILKDINYLSRLCNQEIV